MLRSGLLIRQYWEFAATIQDGGSHMEQYAYAYIGPAEIRRAVASHPAGTPIGSESDLTTWLGSHADAMSEGATYVVDLSGTLRLAPRRSEHVACAGGAEVLAAGEMQFGQPGRSPRVAGASNLSTGYCPDTSCWAAVAHALARAGLNGPSGFTQEAVFRRCSKCGEVNLVKEGWFVCVFCDADLPATWNVSARRPVDLAGTC